MIIRSKAPLRLGLAGGGSDVSPYCDLHGGAILNLTINLYSYATIKPTDNGKIILQSFDRKERVEYDSSPTLPIDGTLDLHKGVYNKIVQKYLGGKPLSFELTTFSDAPSGSGLGTSSTMVVTILGAFIEWLNLPLGEYDIAQLAFEIERVDLNMQGGRQDQYAATFGGVNFMEFYADEKVIVNPLRIKESILQELEHNLLLFYTNTSRVSAEIIKSQVDNIENKTEKSLEAMDNLKKQAFLMKEALLKGDLETIGNILDFGWKSKKNLTERISNNLIDDIYISATKAGATGGKISGAGGGGYMFFYCPENTRYQVIEALQKFEGKLEKYHFTKKGLVSWKR